MYYLFSGRFPGRLHLLHKTGPCSQRRRAQNCVVMVVGSEKPLFHTSVRLCWLTEPDIYSSEMSRKAASFISFRESKPMTLTEWLVLGEQMSDEFKSAVCAPSVGWNEEEMSAALHAGHKLPV